MIDYYEKFATEAEAKAYKERIERAYHPMGYGTTLRIIRPPADGRSTEWTVSGFRSESCD